MSLHSSPYWLSNADLDVIAAGLVLLVLRLFVVKPLWPARTPQDLRKFLRTVGGFTIALALFVFACWSGRGPSPV